MSIKRGTAHRIDAPGAAFHVTVRVNWQTWLLAPEGMTNIFLHQLAVGACMFGVGLVGFVTMSNHAHFIPVSPEDALYRLLTSRVTASRHRRRYPRKHQKASVISQFMKRVMFCSARAIQREFGLSGRFWEDRYHARPLHDAEDVVIALAYDHLNPVEQGIVELPAQYGRSSAAWWEHGAPSPIPLATRLPFGLTAEALRTRVLERQGSERFCRILDQLEAEGIPVRSEAWNARLRDLDGLAPPDAALRRSNP